MKKLIAVIIIGFGFTNLFSQNKMGINQIYIGYGIGNTASQLIKYVDENVNGSFGQIMIGYKRQFGESKFSGGLHGSYCSAYSDYSSNEYIDVKFFHFYSKFDYHWILDEKIDLYSGLGIGVSYVTLHDYSSTEFNAPYKDNVAGIHFNIIGIRTVINDNFSSFVELGYRNLGYLNAGWCYNL